MASHLDLEEQEQLDQLKHFWKTWGNLISWVLIIVLGAYAAWNGWQYWQRNQATKASALYDEVEKAVQAQDLTRVERSIADMKNKFGSTLYAHQAGLVAASVLSEKRQVRAGPCAARLGRGRCPRSGLARNGPDSSGGPAVGHPVGQ